MKKNNFVIIKLKWFSLIGLLLLATFLLPNFPLTKAHTFHTSLTRIDYNSTTQSAELTVRLFTHDLEAMLEKRNGKKIRLDKTKDVDKLVLAYFDKVLIIKDKAGNVKKLSSIGFEQETETIFVYLEAKMPEGLSGATLQNTLFLELNDDQVNLIIIKDGDKKTDLLFKANDKDFKNIEFKKRSDEQ